MSESDDRRGPDVRVTTEGVQMSESDDRRGLDVRE